MHETDHLQVVDMHPLALCLHEIQLSHVYVASNKLDDAKKLCLLAVKALGVLMKTENSNLAATKALAQFAVDYYEKLLKDGLAALTFLQKVLWLASSVNGYTWYPTIAMGSLSSMDIGLVPNEATLKVPELAKISVEFKQTILDWSLDGLDTLYQDLLPNCSFVLSLLLMADMGMGEYLRSLVRKFDLDIKVCLRFDGALREVALTLSLPHVMPPHEDRSLFVRSSSNPHLKWPAYLEKAFLVCLGHHYLFEGSNMAQDTYMLTGWLPEVRKMGDWSTTDIAQLWKLKEEGEVAIGVGTGPFSDTLASQLGVTPQHDYVVCGYDEKTGVTLKNPWGRQKADERVLHVDLSLLGHFSYVYINWKPSYSLRADVVFMTSSSKWEGSYIGDLPQYEFQNVSSTQQNVAILTEQFVGEDSLYCVTVYLTGHGKLYTENQCAHVAGGTFTNSRVQYVKFAAEPLATYTVVVKAVSGSSKFALSVLHDIPELALTKAKLKYAHSLQIEGLWGFGYNGGNWASETYIDNPQYDVMVPQSVSRMMLVLRSEHKADINFHLLYCEDDQVGKKLRNFDKSKILFDERYLEVQVKEAHVEPGNYRLVISSFDRENTGAFTLQVQNNGNAPVALTQVPQALGTFTQSLRFQWNHSNRHKYWVVSDQSPCHVTFWFRANSCGASSPTYRPAIRASLFDSGGDPIAVTKQWNDSIYGVFFECDLEKKAHPYILLIERFETGDGICRVFLGSSSRVEVSQ